MDYLNVSLRMLMAFILVLIFFQFSGNKRQFSQMTSFDLVSNFILSAIFGGYLFDSEISWLGFVSVITVYFVLNGIINYLAKNTAWGRGMIVGTPTVIIDDGKINIRNLKKANMNMLDFMSLLRAKKVHSLKDVKLAQIEIGGALTVRLKGEQNYAMTLIENGKINQENLKLARKSKTWLLKELKKRRTKPEDVFFAQWQNDDLYLVKFQ